MLIVYAEDDIDDFVFFCEVVEDINPSVKIVNTRNGLETITYLETASRLPDIIFIDINMPAMDGKACLRNIKIDPSFKSIPVIIYTTSNNPRDKEHCLQLGAMGYIQKANSRKDAIISLSKFILTGRAQPLDGR